MGSKKEKLMSMLGKAMISELFADDEPEPQQAAPHHDGIYPDPAVCDPRTLGGPLSFTQRTGNPLSFAQRTGNPQQQQTLEQQAIDEALAGEDNVPSFVDPEGKLAQQETVLSADGFLDQIFALIAHLCADTSDARYLRTRLQTKHDIVFELWKLRGSDTSLRLKNQVEDVRLINQLAKFVAGLKGVPTDPASTARIVDAARVALAAEAKENIVPNPFMDSASGHEGSPASDRDVITEEDLLKSIEKARLA